MDYLSWDLAILSRAVAYSNLSGASAHVGLSQPQLSRIVAKLEEQLGITLLDRETKRKSSWTPAAYRLAEIYTNTFHGFKAEVQKLVEGLEPDALRIGALEGLIPLAMDFAKALFDNTKVDMIELDVHDTNVLEEKFHKNELDLIFSSREPGKKKFRFSRVLGYQSIDTVGDGDLDVYSVFEYASQVHKGKSKDSRRAFVSNSLRVRQEWLERFGGKGTLPSAVSQRKTGKKTEVPVIVIAHDHFPEKFWKAISAHLPA